MKRRTNLSFIPNNPDTVFNLPELPHFTDEKNPISRYTGSQAIPAAMVSRRGSDVLLTTPMMPGLRQKPLQHSYSLKSAGSAEITQSLHFPSGSLDFEFSSGSSPR
jgi:hypothetical protein